MYRTFLIGLSIVAATLSFAGMAWAATPTSVSYVIQPKLLRGEIESVRIELHFVALTPGALTLELPSRWAGGVEFYRRLENLEVVGADKVDTVSPYRRVLTVRAHAPVTIAYELKRNIATGHMLPAAGNYTYPAIGANWFYFGGPSAIARIGGLGATRTHFIWKLPRGWRGISRMPPDESAKSGADPSGAVFLGGKDLRIRTLRADGATVEFASIGLNRGAEQNVTQILQSVATAERGFWGTRERPVLVTMMPADPVPNGKASFRGTRLPGGIMMMSSGPIDMAQLKYLIAHEYLHSWIPDRLIVTPITEDERLIYWFSEGFTDYYARRILLNCGLITPTEFSDLWNDTLRAYAASRFINTPNGEVAGEFWNDPGARQLPYQRGALFAVWLEALLASRSQSIDDLMKVLLRKSTSGTSTETTEVTLIRQLGAAGGKSAADITAGADRFIGGGATVDLPRDAFGSGFEASTETVPIRDVGYNIDESSKAGIFLGVDETGPAYRAGIRNGFRRIRPEGGDPFDSRVPLTWRFYDSEGVERETSYRPEGKTLVRRQHLQPRPGFSLKPQPWCHSSPRAG